MHALIETHSLGSLITMGSEGLMASHIPMVLESKTSELGILRGHISRANTQWKTFASEIEALAIFAGPQHYISPNWYPSKLEDGKDVPTWNYAVVHAYGPLRVIPDHEWLMQHLESLTNFHEASFEKPWKVSDAPRDFIETLLNGIIGLELTIRRLEGKWKVSQNRTEVDRQGVVEGLSNLNTPESLAMKELVRGNF